MSPVSFQEPMSIIKSKPLKSEKDRLLQIKEKSGKKLTIPCKEPPQKIVIEKQPRKECASGKLEPGLIPQIKDLKIQVNKTEVVRPEKSIEVKPSKKASPPDEVLTEKTVE